MKIPNFWIRVKRTGQFPDGKSFEILQYGCSDESLERAREDGEQRAAELLEKLSKGKRLRSFGPRGDYALARPIREEIISNNSLHNARIVITRNAYGAKVLNTDRIMFIDVDLARHFPGFDLLARLIAYFKKLMMDDVAKARVARAGQKQTPIIATTSEQERKVINYLESYCKRNPEFGIRIYRTKAGMRLLVTHAFFVPEAKDSQNLMQELGVDPLYAHICQTQQCFRARLGPKPWRCGHKRPKVRYPYEKHEEEIFKAWLAEYESKKANYRTCEFLGALGNSKMPNEISTCVRLHDEESGALGLNLKLA